MLKSKYVCAAALVAAFTALTFSSVARQQPLANPTAPVVQDITDPEEANFDPLSRTATFFSLRADTRDCVSPMCGGYFVSRVNMSVTRCANGKYRGECYVAEIDWNGQKKTDVSHLLVRGEIVAKRFPNFGNLGALRVTESWMTASDNKPNGTYYLVRDRGLRCITFPCPTHHEAQLNARASQDIAGVELDKAGLGENNASVALAAMTAPDGVIIVGEHKKVNGPAGYMEVLQATQVYSRDKPQSATKPCIKTGCSSQVCADHDVITTCEFRPEYACYQKAKCERQSNGNCGFTQTRELAACLRRR